MINWYGLFTNSLWMIGAALLLASLSWSLYAAALARKRWRALWEAPGFTLGSSAGMALIMLGLGLQRRTPLWQSAIWLLLALAFGLMAWLAWRERRGLPVEIRPLVRAQISGVRGMAIGLILLGALLAAMYAVTIRPWMQPDEPRHYEVAMHDARLGRPGATYGDVNLDWERELIADMEAQSFWWYGYSVTGWDPDHLPESFDVIWEPRYSRAFFQLPLYYDIAGLLLYTWGDDLSFSQSVILLRFFGIFWLALSLGGIYAIGRELFPKHPQIALGALAFAALWPAHLAANAAVNNDPMAEALVIWTTFFAIRLLRRGPNFKTLTWFFLLTILSIYTKRTTFSVLALLLTIPLWGALQIGRNASRRARAIGIAMLAGGVAAIPLLLYVIQATGKYWLPTSLLENASFAKIWTLIAAAPLDKFLLSLYRTFWGWFGWLRIPLPDVIYWAGAVITLGLIALLLLGYLQILNKKMAAWQKAALILLLLTLITQVGLTLGKDIVYGDWKGGSVPQMRYLYPVLPAILIPIFLGAQRILPASRRSAMLPALIIALLFFNFYILAFILYPFFWL